MLNISTQKSCGVRGKHQGERIIIIIIHIISIIIIFLGWSQPELFISFQICLLILKRRAPRELPRNEKVRNTTTTQAFTISALLI